MSETDDVKRFTRQHPFCAYVLGTAKCPHVAAIGSNFCRTHEPDKAQIEFNNLLAYGNELSNIATRLNVIAQEVLVILSKKVKEEPPSRVPGVYFLNETHEFNPITKQELRRQRDAARKTNSESKDKTKKFPTSGSRSKPARRNTDG